MIEIDEDTERVLIFQYFASLSELCFIRILSFDIYPIFNSQNILGF